MKIINIKYRFLNGSGKWSYLPLVVLINLLVIQTSCRKFVEIPPPVTQLVTASVFNNDATAIAAQTAIYTQMYQESYNLAQNTGLLSDELNNYSNSATQKQFYTNEMSATPGVTGPWQNAYSYIYQANSIIAGLQNNNGVSAAVKQQLTGESKFIRAFWLFYLTNLYGDVPLVTSTDYTINDQIARTRRTQVYQQIIADLKEAQNLLSSSYLDGTNTSGTTERVRPTKWSANALLARVYLYTGKNYADAETQASTVINHTDLYNLLSDLNQVFLANSSESIWQLQIPLPNGGYNTPDGQNFILLSSPANAGVNSGVSVSLQLLNSFESGDNRKTNWIGSFTSGSDTWYFPYKYKVQQSSTVSEYLMVLRLAEQYLIRAEAKAEQGNLSGAIADINLLRSVHGGLTSPLPVPAKLSDCLAIILHERQVELFTEWGNRWFDLIRTGNANVVMGVVTPLKGGTWNPNGKQELYPIPQIEISKDHNLTQNPGY